MARRFLMRYIGGPRHGELEDFDANQPHILVHGPGSEIYRLTHIVWSVDGHPSVVDYEIADMPIGGER